MEKQLISFTTPKGKLQTQGYLWQLVSKVVMNSDGSSHIETIAIVEDSSSHQLRQANLSEFEIAK